MDINIEYLRENEESINEYITSFKMITGAYSLMESDEVEILRENMVEESVDKFIAFSHAIDGIPLDERMVNYVNSRGERGLRKSRQDRSTMAFKKTGISKMKRREISLKATKTKSARPSKQVGSKRKRNKALTKRGSLGFDNE